jgi:tryptophan synthase alpha subunit
MGYFNPMMAYGFDKLAAETKEAGADGFIIVDLPVSVDHRKHIGTCCTESRGCSST